MTTFLGLRLKRPTPLSIFSDCATAGFVAVVAILGLANMGFSPSDTVREPGFYMLLVAMFLGGFGASIGITSPQNGIRGKLMMFGLFVPLIVLLMLGFTYLFRLSQ